MEIHYVVPIFALWMYYMYPMSALGFRPNFKLSEHIHGDKAFKEPSYF